MTNELTDDDLAVLIEALDSWIDKDALADTLEGLVQSMIPNASDEAKQKMVATKEERLKAKRVRKERAIILQAKIIGMKDHLLVDGVAAELGQK